MWGVCSNAWSDSFQLQLQHHPWQWVPFLEVCFLHLSGVWGLIFRPDLRFSELLDTIRIHNTKLASSLPDFLISLSVLGACSV
jgi:hypothetical protein